MLRISSVHMLVSTIILRSVHSQVIRIKQSPFFECEIDSSDNICAILKGNKTIAFFRGIYTNGQCDEITVDGHAFNIWRGLYTSLNEVPVISNKLYRTVSDDYKAAAVAINEQTKSDWSASQIQAITWVCWRRQNGVVKITAIAVLLIVCILNCLGYKLFVWFLSLFVPKKRRRN